MDGLASTCIKSPWFEIHKLAGDPVTYCDCESRLIQLLSQAHDKQRFERHDMRY